MSALLNYVVNATLQGEGERLKGYSIGIDVFERQADFDPSTDAIVRVQMGRLRRLLDTYYLGDGAYDPVRIRIPKGAYQPEFTLRAVASQPDSSAVGTASGRKPFPERFWIAALAVSALLIVALGYVALFKDTRLTSPESETSLETGSRDTISLAVLPLRGGDADSTSKFVARGISEELVSTLTRIPSLTVSSPSAVASALEGDRQDIREIGEALDVEYILEGSLQYAGNRFRLTVQLSSTESGTTVWAETYDTQDEDIFDVQDEIIAALAQEVRPQLRSAAQEAISRKPTSEQTAWDLYLQATWTPGASVNAQDWQEERIELAARALELEPEFGPAHSVMATKLTYMASMVPEFDTHALRRKADYHADRAIELSPDDPEVLNNVAIHFWRSGDLDRSERLFSRVLDLDPTHPAAAFLVYMVPYYCASAPEEVMQRLEAYDAQLSPDNPIRWVTHYTLGQTRLSRGDYERAAEDSRYAYAIFHNPESMFLYAAALVHLGDAETALEISHQQKESWPGLSPQHFAKVTMKRRCEGGSRREEVMRVFSEMADVLESPA